MWFYFWRISGSHVVQAGFNLSMYPRRSCKFWDHRYVPQHLTNFLLFVAVGRNKTLCNKASSLLLRQKDPGFSFGMVLGIEFRDRVYGKWFATELHPQPLFLIYEDCIYFLLCCRFYISQTGSFVFWLHCVYFVLKFQFFHIRTLSVLAFDILFICFIVSPDLENLVIFQFWVLALLYEVKVLQYWV